MNKEWLEDKKKQLNSATIFINENGNEAVEVSLTVLNKLFEQAERVQGLEENNRTFRKNNKRLRKENQRYREALEFGIEYLKNSDIRQVQLVVTALKSALEESE